MMFNDPYSELYRWLKHHESRSYTQIMIACKSLARKHGFNELATGKSIFDRLYRIGVIEFAGENCYTMGPSIIVINRTKRICTALNCSFDSRKKLLARFEGEESICGIVKFTYQEGCTDFFMALNMRYIYSEVDSQLEKIPFLGSVVRQFEKSTLISEYYWFYDLASYSWIRKKQEDGLGICKIDEATNNIFIISGDGNTYKVPSLGLNPEGFQVALNYQRELLGGDGKLDYNPIKKTLQVYYPKLPVIVERLLRLSSIHVLNLNYMDKVGFEFDEISVPTYKRVRRILTI